MTILYLHIHALSTQHSLDSAYICTYDIAISHLFSIIYYDTPLASVVVYVISRTMHFEASNFASPARYKFKPYSFAELL